MTSFNSIIGELVSAEEVIAFQQKNVEAMVSAKSDILQEARDAIVDESDKEAIEYLEWLNYSFIFGNPEDLEFV